MRCCLLGRLQFCLNTVQLFDHLVADGVQHLTFVVKGAHDLLIDLGYRLLLQDRHLRLCLLPLLLHELPDFDGLCAKPGP